MGGWSEKIKLAALVERACERMEKADDDGRSCKGGLAKSGRG